jgi:hypothetical protein
MANDRLTCWCVVSFSLSLSLSLSPCAWLVSRGKASTTKAIAVHIQLQLSVWRARAKMTLVGVCATEWLHNAVGFSRERNQPERCCVHRPRQPTVFGNRALQESEHKTFGRTKRKSVQACKGEERAQQSAIVYVAEEKKNPVALNHAKGNTVEYAISNENVKKWG